MNFFPAPDPIPLPAPVWLFKALHLTTLSLHFVAVEIMIGGLLAAIWLNLISAGRQGEKALLRQNAAGALARRLPIVMTFVINLGVPPLLFAQALYGQALYTSSVLLGAWWISVIVLLTLCYWLLYLFAADTEQAKAGWWKGLLAWLLAAAIAKIYTTNMTLMIRPEVWTGMYAKTAHGYSLPPSEPVLMLRWGYMMLGGLVVAGLWMLWISGRKSIDAALGQYLAQRGGRLALLSLALAFLGLQVAGHLTPDIRQAIAGKPLYHLAGYAWMVTLALVFLVGLWAAMAKSASKLLAWVGPLVGILMVASMTIYRDGIRDLTLLGQRFNVWDSKVVTNWSVVIIFLISFVAGLAAMGWLISVMMRAKTVNEKVNA